MTDPALPILADYLDGKLTADAAAGRLHDLLTSGTDLSLEIGPRVIPVFEALHARLHPGTPLALPPAPPVAWDPSPWGDLTRTAEDIWPVIEAGRLETTPLSLDYSFRVGSEAALAAIEAWLAANTDHLVLVERPPSFTYCHGIVRARTPARVLTRADVAAWAAELARIPVFESASPEGLGLSRPGSRDAS